MVDYLSLVMQDERWYETHCFVLYSHQRMTWVGHQVNSHAILTDLGLVSLLHRLFNEDLAT
jgi:hypothetical protein